MEFLASILYLLLTIYCATMCYYAHENKDYGIFVIFAAGGVLCCYFWFIYFIPWFAQLLNF